MQEDTYVTTSDLKKDYMAFVFMCDQQPKEELIYGIHHFIEGKQEQALLEDDHEFKTPQQTPREYQGVSDDDETNDSIPLSKNIDSRPVSRKQELSETDKRNNVVKRMQVESFSDLDESDASKIQTEVVVHRSFPRLDIIDITALAKAISFVPFDFVKLTLISCGLTEKAIKALGMALTHKKTLRFLSLEMNPLTTMNQEKDEILLDRHPAVQKLFNSISPKFENTDEDTNDKTKKKTVKKDKPKGDETRPEIQQLLERYCGPNSSPFAPLFMTSAKYLSLRGNNLNDNDALSIAELLKDDGEIFSLNLWGNSITDVGGVALAKSLRTNQKLLSISLAMNRIGDDTVMEICRSMSAKDIFTEEEFLTLREQSYTSFYGYLNIPKDPNTNAYILPALPPHLLPPVDDKKKKPAASTKPPSKGSSIEKDVIPWDNNSIRHVYETPKSTSPPSTAKNTKGAKTNPTPSPPPQTEVEPQPPKPLYRVPGNTILRNINLSANANVSDEGAQYFVEAIENNSNICRISLSDTSVSDVVFDQIVSKLLSCKQDEINEN
ncbi:hypothetical protein C9374_006704 [Naegleria lovaniensis]|uniref:Leucine Rich Repeat family protein n=1 Tax=Naegleria lovaniensis TaxID=51637 RepID=A0AA88KGY1_NAELO|nr:uncharacterized protein C9374_006704 [Naegleria lovaniensis]KAG2379587.1 hypothetical protein C9374_006704 [Naegleria lovaniensis]